MLITFNWPFFFLLICNHKLAHVNLLVNISCKIWESKWTVFKQIIHTFSRTIFPFSCPLTHTLKLALESEMQRISAGVKDFICLFLYKTNRPSACGEKYTNFFLLKISQKQLLLSYFEWIFWEQLVTAISYMVDVWQEPGSGREISKT